ncbi:hypothetical protein MAUB1S_05191 [Mycolicibacterium aubagnense]
MSHSGEILRLEATLQNVHPDLLAALAPGASAAQLDELERVVGQPLTPILRDLLSWHNGVRSAERAVRVRIDNWVPMPVDAIIDAVEMMRELLHGEPGWIEQTWWNEDWVPFLDNTGGNYLCVDLTGDSRTLQRNGKPYQGIPGQLIYFDHEAEWRTVEAPSLQTWLTALADIIDGARVTPTSTHDVWGSLYAFDEPLGQSALTETITRLAPGYPFDVDCPR